MADQKISELTAATAIDGTEQIPILQAGVNKRYSINGTLFDKEVVSFDGTNFRDKSDNIITITGDGLVLQDLLDADFVRVDVNGDLIDGSSAVISGTLTAATNADLPAASGVSGKIYASLDPGDNGVYGLPADCYSDGSKYRFMGGAAIIAAASLARKITCPAATFTGTYTLADSAGSVSVSSAGVHGLSTAGQYVVITAGTGWTLGQVKIASVTDTDTIVLDHAYDVGLGQPTFALAGSNFVARRIKLPPLNNDSRVMTRITYDHSKAASGSTALWMEHVALAGALGSVSGSDFYNPAAQTTDAPIVHAIPGFFCASSATTKKGLQVKTDNDGFGLNTVGDETTWELAHTLETEILIAMNIASANDSIEINIWEVEVRL